MKGSIWPGPRQIPAEHSRRTREHSPGTPVTESSPELSVVVPVFNEGANVEALIARLRPVLDRCVASWEVVFVDDGSRDDTLAAACGGSTMPIRAAAPSRSAAISARRSPSPPGSTTPAAGATVIMDADLQHPPELIETFVARWREGYSMVFGQRTDREARRPGPPLPHACVLPAVRRLRRDAAAGGRGRFPPARPQAVEALRSMGERARFSKGLYAWIGFPSIGVPFDVAKREHGASKFNVAQAVPLRASTASPRSRQCR